MLFYCNPSHNLKIKQIDSYMYITKELRLFNYCLYLHNKR
jgi:hypothetical protein